MLSCNIRPIRAKATKWLESIPSYLDRSYSFINELVNTLLLRVMTGHFALPNRTNPFLKEATEDVLCYGIHSEDKTNMSSCSSIEVLTSCDQENSSPYATLLKTLNEKIKKIAGVVKLLWTDSELSKTSFIKASKTKVLLASKEIT